MNKKDYNWVYDHADKLVHVVMKKSKISECQTQIFNGITMQMLEMEINRVKNLCPKCKDLCEVMVVLNT